VSGAEAVHPAPTKAQFERVGRGPRRVTRWDRSPEPRDWRFVVGWLGRILIVLGLLMFLFVAYQLWGTGIETARAQNRLEDRFEQLIADVPEPTTPAVTVPTPASPPTTVAATPTTTIPATTVADATHPDTTVPATTAPEAVPGEDQGLPPVESGEPLALLEIPTIDVSMIVVPGVTHNDLKAGPGHFPDTPLPGQLGNSAIAGHRTTYKAPFGDLDQLAIGDTIEITMLNRQHYTYVVTGSEVVRPNEYRVISDSDPTRATLTLITCTPKGTSTHRLVVYAELDTTTSGPVGEPTYYDPDYEPAADIDTAEPTLPGDEPVTTTPTSDATPTPGDPGDGAGTGFLDAPVSQQSDAFSEGWFHDSAAWPQIILWGLALAVITTGGWWVARFFKREWAGCLAGAVPFVACLYFFFQNVNRLLPPGL